MRDRTFEQGPIRPPSEAGSLLLRFTRNCPWNRCTFCPVYKGTRFSRRSLDEIKRDIDSAAEIVTELRAMAGSHVQGTRLPREALNHVYSSPHFNNYYKQIALWLHIGQESVFIQDANSLVLPAEQIAEAIRYLRERIPGVGRITSYARSSTLARKSIEDLVLIRQAGLDRIHIGMESGSDKVLEFVQKGVSAAEHIEAGCKVKAAGMELSEYYMPGLGGQALTRDHAIESARVLNRINPDFIRLRSLRVPRRAPLFKDLESGRFTLLSDDDTVREIRLFVESLEGIDSRVVSDHIMNLLEEVTGKLPEDKEAMLAVIDRYLALPDEDRLLFRLGRRGGGLRSVDEFEDPVIRCKLKAALGGLSLQTGDDVEKLIRELADQYI